MQVSIEGLVDSDVTTRGETVDVELTPFVQGLIRSKIVRVTGVTRHDPVDTVWPVNPEPVPDVDTGPDTVAAAPEPTRTAPRRQWREFLTDQGIDVPEEASRAELRELWVNRD